MISIVCGVIGFLGRPTFFPIVGMVLVVLYWVYSCLNRLGVIFRWFAAVFMVMLFCACCCRHHLSCFLFLILAMCFNCVVGYFLEGVWCGC